MRKIAVIIYGSPGSGKGTQANFLAQKLDLIHFDTGKFCESVVHDPARQKERTVQRERKLFDSGILMTPTFVLGEVSRAVTKIAKAGWGVVMSGSPRTVYEAGGLIPLLEKLYGRKNIFIFVLKIPAAVSIRRNSRRILCKACNAPLLTQYYPSKNPEHCPICGGPFYRRTLDNAETISVRLREYANRTEPVFKVLRKRGYRLREIDGRPAPYKVFKSIVGALSRVVR